MTFIECFSGETDPMLFLTVKEAYGSVFTGAFPVITFGRLIEWKARLFREVLVTAEGHNRLRQEDYIFHCFTKNRKRATVQLGSLNGIGFETPPSSGAEKVALIIDHGLQSTINPFIYAKKA